MPTNSVAGLWQQSTGIAGKIRRPMASRSWPFVQRVGIRFRGWFMADGKRHYLPLRDTAREASGEAVAARDKVSSVLTNPTSIGAAADEFLAEVRTTRRTGTWLFYSQQFEAIFKVVPRARPMAMVTDVTLRHFIHESLATLHYSAQTVQHRRTALRRLFRWAKRRGYADSNPTEAVDWPRVDQNQFDVIGEDDLRRMLTAILASPEDYDLVSVALYTGLRRSEMARLRVQDIDAKAGIYWIHGKRRKEPQPIPAEVRASFTAMVDRAVAAKREHLLPASSSPRGPHKAEVKRPLSADERALQLRAYTVTNVFRKWAKRLNDRRFHAHTLRHSLATALIRSGSGEDVVRRILRHSSVQTTRIYIHLVAADLKNATSRLRLLPNAGADESDHG